MKTTWASPILLHVFPPRPVLPRSKEDGSRVEWGNHRGGVANRRDKGYKVRGIGEGGGLCRYGREVWPIGM